MVTEMTTEATPVVLVADDEPSMLALVGQHIKTMGYRVLEASDGEQAWALAQEHLPDLVILDVMMPGMSGWEVCRKIREDVALAHTAIIMLTGIGENLNELTSPLYGADSYIDKPFAFPELDEKVRGALTKRRGSRPGLARTEPDEKESNGNGGQERNLLSPSDESTETEAQAEAVDEAWNEDRSEVTNGADETILLVETSSVTRGPGQRRKAPSTKPKAKAKAKKAAKPKPKPKPKTKTKAKAKAKTKTKTKAKAVKPKASAKPKKSAAKRPAPKKAAAKRSAKPKKKARR
jgi:DNA-binding response OmpR family regulator